jgi:hypothetical protein
MKNIVLTGLRIKRSSSEDVCLKFSGGDKYKDSITIAGHALVACRNKILLHALRIKKLNLYIFNSNI